MGDQSVNVKMTDNGAVVLTAYRNDKCLTYAYDSLDEAMGEIKGLLSVVKEKEHGDVADEMAKDSSNKVEQMKNKKYMEEEND